MTSFETAYKCLNLAQKQAVDAIEGPVMVIAGPGTGKTQILTLRIANILRRTDTEPENVLALTFTEAGVASMRKRLIEFVGSPAYGVYIKTFHGFCNDIIKDYPEEFSMIIGSKNINEVDQIKIVEELIDSLPLRELKPFGDVFYYLRPIIAALNELKREGVTVEKFEEAVAEEAANFEKIDDLIYEKGPHKGKMKGKYQDLSRRISKNKDLVLFYGKYEERLRKDKLYDYSDMIMEVLRTLEKNSDLLLRLQEEYQYVLVDEHQDTNNSQNRILELLCNFHENPNIFVVGDEKQAIFRFQGASIENFLYFKSLYPGARLVTLEENYRSTQSILSSAESLIAGEKKLQAKAGHPEKKISLCEFIKPETENRFVAEEIKKKMDAGAAPNEIAVLYRENKDAFPVAEALDKAGVPYIIESDQDILSDLDIRKIVLLLQAVDRFGDQEKFIEAMHIDFLRIPPIDVYKLIEHANRNKISVFDLSRDAEALESIGLVSPEIVLDFFGKMSRWFTLSRNKYLTELFETVARESGFLSAVLQGDNVIEEMDKVSGLFREMKEFLEKHKSARLRDFLEYLEMLAEHNVLLKKGNMARLAKGVRLMTAHKSKGQEFDCVYIIDARDGHWGNKRKPNYLPLPPRIFSLLSRDLGAADSLDDERRLFYVALTRAKKEAMISYSKTGADGREQLPSQFVTEIDPALVDKLDVKEFENHFDSHRELIFEKSSWPKISVKDKDFIRELFLRNGLSVTALNNYLACPWEYFYTNLFRIPKAKTKHQMYGTAVHGALRDFFSAMRENPADKDFFIDRFVYHLKKEPLSEKDFEASLEKGRKSLEGYYDKYAGTWPRNSLLEFNIKGIELAKDVKINGKIDRMDMIGSGAGVGVVDFKTGRPKTRGQIEGTTKDSRGDIKRQLVFYKLLLDNFKSAKYRLEYADVDFVEPDQKGVYRRERFTIGDEDTENLKGLVLRTADEILNLDFWDRKCEDKDCPYCALRQMMS
ncbi:MAG: ATP-dependent helicase [Patescibacteria group bacterium]|nr:ATP-dependent helicase [Patescibacteria group bacterium]MCL5262016.1 ATP-dependent helicase [Patescibacteria group bacterium]